MPGHVNAGGVLFHLQLGFYRAIRQIRQFQFRVKQRLFFPAAEHVEQAHLPGHVLLFLRLVRVHGGLVHRQHLWPVGAESVKGPGPDQAFRHALVAFRRIDPPAEIEDIPEGASVFTFPDNRRHCVLAHALDRAEAEQDRRLAAPVPVNGELPAAPVHVRRQYGDILSAAVLDIPGDFAGVAVYAVQHRRHELHRIVPFQPGGLHGHHTVGRGVGFVESVAGESDHLVIELVRHVFRHPVAHAAGHGHVAVLVLQAIDEDLPFRLHDLVFLFRHGAAHQVAPAVAVARQIPHDLHDLLLIHHAPISHVQDRPQLFRLILHAGRIRLPGDVARDGIHGTRAVEGDRRDDILKAARFHVRQEAGHARAFHLEHAFRIAPADHLIDFRIVQRDILRSHVRSGFPHHIQRVPDHRQRPQAQEVHLQQAQPLDRSHGILGGDYLVVPLQRHEFHHGFPGNQHARRVGGRVPRHPLQGHCRVDQFPDLRLVVIHLPQHRGNLQRFAQSHTQVKGNRLGHGVRLLVTHSQHPTDVPHNALGRHRTEGDDLAHMVRSVFPGDIVDNLLPPFVAEVHVDIRHAHPFRVQEALKQQLVLQRIQHRDAQRVGDDGAGAAAASRAYHDSVGFRIVNEVPHDQEIVHIAHMLDRGKFILQPLPGLVPLLRVRIELLHAFRAQAAQHALRRLAFRHGIMWQAGHAELKLDVAALRDLLRPVHGIRDLAEDCPHLLFTFNV